MKKPPILIIAGPTASGKSAIALEVAEKAGGVIINADSQQVYAELRVLTARPTPDDEARAPHRLYGTLPACEACSAGKWLRMASMEIDWALGNGQPVILVGGTGLYIRALTEGLSSIPDIPPEIRAQAKADLAAMGHEAFHERLSAVDSASMVKIRPSDTQRMTRAWEVWLATGKPLSWWQENSKSRPYDNFRIVMVTCEREALYARCDARFSTMINNGVIDEVRSLLTMQIPESLPSMRIIGVPELRSYLEKRCRLEEALVRGQQATRNYAKRQQTWFRNQLKADHIINTTQDYTVEPVMALVGV